MKKIFLIPVLFLTLFVTMNKVNADTYTYDYIYPPYNRVSSSDFMAESQLVQLFEDSKNELINYWRDNLSSDYPYYFLHMESVYGLHEIPLMLIYSSSTSTLSDMLVSTSSWPYFYPQTSSSGFLIKTIFSDDGTPTYPTLENRSPANNTNWVERRYFEHDCPGNVGTCTDIYRFNPFSYYQSNFNAIYTGSDVLNVVKDNDIIFTISNGDTIPSYVDEFDISQTFTEVNLNNYSSIILSLKDYTERSTFNTTIYTLGQLCFTPVYNYGMTNKGDLYSGYTVQGCSDVYNTFSPVTISILSSDISNHAVYYVNAYNYSIENKVKIDTSIFDITYVTSENASNPSVIIGGRSYPVIPYSDLSSSATISTNNGYIPGVSCAVGDMNCYAEYNDFNFADIFTHPLELLQSFWSSIVAIFSMITAFIMLLPPTLQIFMFSAFMFAVILGLIKIIL